MWFCSVVVAGACGFWVLVWVGWVCYLGVGSLACMLIGLLWLPFGGVVVWLLLVFAGIVIWLLWLGWVC